MHAAELADVAAPLVDIPGLVGVTSPLAVAIGMVYLIFTGRLYVRSAHDAVVRVLENQLKAVTEDRNIWRTSSLEKDAALAALVRTNARFIESANFSDHVMSALQESAGGSHEIVS
jgi:hypothetical protein